MRGARTRHSLGGDIKAFYPPAGRFDVVIGGPPCQQFSRMRHLVDHNDLPVAENLIPEFERCVAEAQPRAFLMENVPAAPLPEVAGYSIHSFRYNNRWTGAVQERVRRFSFGMPGNQPVDLQQWMPRVEQEAEEYAPAVCANGGLRKDIPRVNGKIPARAYGYKSEETLKDSIRLQGLPEGFLDKSPFTIWGKHKVIGNGVPLPLGRALANAVKQALSEG